ncbi:MAG: hypothetical protein JWM68_980 [Verrucomicrobiales bacterium]|nr:hypothetical protein [Verrucomicrobiales bacterium]
MKRCIALVLLTFAMGVLATTSHGQSYRPCFDDPAFEESSYATVEFETPQIISGNQVIPQIEKPIFEIASFDKSVWERSEWISPQFVIPEFDNACQKPSAPAAPLKIVWLSSYQPGKTRLMQPLAGKQNQVSTVSKPIDTRLLAFHRSR